MKQKAKYLNFQCKTNHYFPINSSVGLSKVTPSLTVGGNHSMLSSNPQAIYDYPSFPIDTSRLFI